LLAANVIHNHVNLLWRWSRNIMRSALSIYTPHSLFRAVKYFVNGGNKMITICNVFRKVWQLRIVSTNLSIFCKSFAEDIAAFPIYIFLSAGHENCYIKPFEKIRLCGGGVFYKLYLYTFLPLRTFLRLFENLYL